MSVQAIEDMIKFSIRVVYYNGGAIKNISPREICRNLYKLLNKFGCDCDAPQMRNELEALGYLKVFSIEDLPEQECAALEKLGESRFFKGAYVDTKECIYVIYATEMWDLLKEAGIIREPKERPKKLSAYRLARMLVPVALNQREKPGEIGDNAIHFLAYCYVYLPVLMRVGECRGIKKNDLEKLRDMIATPEMFKIAIELGLVDELEDLDGIGEEYGAAYLNNYEEPYIAWRDSEDGIVIDECELKKKVYFYRTQGRYKKADKFALRLSEADVYFFRATTVLSHCAEFFASGKMDEYPFCDYSTAQILDMIGGHSYYSVQQAAEDISKLIQTRAEKPVTAAPLYIILARCFFFMRDWGAGIKNLNIAFDLIFKEAKKKESLLLSANVTAGYCQEIINFCPRSILQNSAIPKDFLSVEQARLVLEKESENKAISAGRCCRLAALYVTESSPKKAAAWLIKARELDKNNDYSSSIMLMEQKLRILTIAVVREEFKHENVLGIKYFKGLQLAYFKTERSAQWREFESVYRGAREKDIEKLRALYRDIPENLIKLLEIVDGTYQRKYVSSAADFAFFGSDLNEVLYGLFSSKQISDGKQDALKLKELISRRKFYSRVDEKITDDENNVNWLHFANSLEREPASQLYIDFSPSEKGKKGQIVRFWHDKNELMVIADGFDDYLKKLMNENYSFVIPEKKRANTFS